jgi:ATP-dependent Zn protease
MSTKVLEPVRGTERLLTAFHEAGHAVMAQLCGHQITRVEIEGDAERTGSTSSLRYRPDPLEVVDPAMPTAHLERRLLCILAGSTAEAMVGGSPAWDESAPEIGEAVRLALRVVGDCAEVLPYLERARDLVDELLRRHWDAVEIVGQALVDRGELTGSEVRRLVAPYLPT